MLRMMTMMMGRSFREQDGGEGGAGGGGKKEPPTPEVFSKEYVKELRQEAAGYRLKAQEHEGGRKAAEEAAAKAATERDNAVKAANDAANARVIRAELKAAAIKAGMIDIDGLKLADLSKVKLGEDGEVAGADELMAEMKKAKPYLFGTGSSSNTDTKPPKSGDKGKVDVTQMTPQEYEAAKRAAIAGSRR